MTQATLRSQATPVSGVVSPGVGLAIVNAASSIPEILNGV